MTGEPLIDLVFGGRLRLRAIGDRLGERREFARAVGIRLLGAGFASLAASLSPSDRVDRHSRTASRLESLRAPPRGVPARSNAYLQQAQQSMPVQPVSHLSAVPPWVPRRGPPRDDSPVRTE